MLQDSKKSYFTPIGLDIRDTALHAAQFHVSPAGRSLSYTASESIQPTPKVEDRMPAVIAALRKLLHDNQFLGNKVISALPKGQVDMRPLNLAPGITPDDTEAFQQGFMKSASASLPYSTQDALIDYLPIGMLESDGQSKYSVLLIATRRENVNRHLAMLREVNLQSEHLDTSPSAVSRIYQTNNQTVAVLDMDMNGTIISICQDKRLLFSRLISLGTADIVKKLAKNLDLDRDQATNILEFCGLESTPEIKMEHLDVEQSGVLDATAIRGLLHDQCLQALSSITLEIKRSTDYYIRQRQSLEIDAMYLTGNVLHKNLGACFEKDLKIPVHVQPALDHLKQAGLCISDSHNGNKATTNCRLQLDSPFATAIGLSLRNEI